MCIVSFKKINLNSKFRNGRFTKNNLQYTMCLFIPNSICKNILITSMLYKIDIANNLGCEFTYLQIKNVVSNYVIHKNIIFQSIFFNAFK